MLSSSQHSMLGKGNTSTTLKVKLSKQSPRVAPSVVGIILVRSVQTRKPAITVDRSNIPLRAAFANISARRKLWLRSSSKERSSPSNAKATARSTLSKKLNLKLNVMNQIEEASP